MAIDPLFTPFKIKNLTLKNRIISTPHEPAYTEDGLAKDRYRAYHVEKAKGGVSLTMTAGSALVSRGSAPAFGNLQLWKDETEYWLRLLADEVHQYDCAVMIQISHMGHRSSNYADEWVPTVSASAVREPSHRAFTKAAEVWDMEQIKQDYVAAAKKIAAAGLDGLEINLYGHYLDAFITPFWNQRDDEFGGSHENRMRYPLEVIRAIKAEVPEDFIVGARMSFDEDRENGLGPGELYTVAEDFISAGIDFISGVTGSIESDGRLTRVLPVMGMNSAPQLEAMGEAKRKLSVPFMHAAKIADVPTARYAIEAGLLDLVGMTRAIMADPYLPLKIAEGREDEIRPCVGASMCIDGIYMSGAAYCVHNPSTGRELTLPQTLTPATQLKRTAVVGGGPAGMEAARVLAERGHSVTLFEAGDRLGGQINLAVRSPRRRDLQGIIDWRVQELKRLNVDVQLNSYVDANDIRSGQYDAVIVATGGIPNSTKFVGSQFVSESWDVISGAKRVTGSALVYDDHGGTQALDLAEILAASGVQVELVTPERNLAIEVGGMIASGYFKSLSRQGAKFTILRQIKEVAKNADGTFTVTLGMEDESFVETRVVDAVIAETGTMAISDVYDELVAESINGGEVALEAFLNGQPQQAIRNSEGKFKLFRIGDAVSSRNIHTAMLDAHRICRGI